MSIECNPVSLVQLGETFHAICEDNAVTCSVPSIHRGDSPRKIWRTNRQNGSTFRFATRSERRTERRTGSDCPQAYQPPATGAASQDCSPGQRRGGCARDDATFGGCTHDCTDLAPALVRIGLRERVGTFGRSPTIGDAANLFPGAGLRDCRHCL